MGANSKPISDAMYRGDKGSEGKESELKGQGHGRKSASSGTVAGEGLLKEVRVSRGLNGGKERTKRRSRQGPGIPGLGVRVSSWVE